MVDTKSNGGIVPSPDWSFVGLAIAFLMCNVWLLVHDQPRTMVASLMLGQLAALVKINRSVGLSAAFAFLFLLGDIRRINGLFFYYSKFDILLL
jgi:hypothetical protein